MSDFRCPSCSGPFFSSAGHDCCILCCGCSSDNPCEQTKGWSQSIWESAHAVENPLPVGGKSKTSSAKSELIPPMIITVDETVATPQLHRGTSRRAETVTRPSQNFFRSDFRNRDREFSHPSFEDVDWRQYYAPWFIPPPPPHPHFM